MSNYQKMANCKNCKQVTLHNFYDNTPKHHHYTKECQECKLRTEL